MIRPQGKGLILTRAVLASTMFMGSIAQATTYGPHSTIGPIQTSVVGNIEILGGNALTAGQIIGNDTDAVQLDKASTQVLVDANNLVYGINAIETTGSGSVARGINISAANGVVVIGALSGIDATNTVVGSDGILLGSKAASITNAGTVRSGSSAIEVNAGDGIITSNFPGILLGTNTQQQPTFWVHGGSTDNTSLINAGRIQAFSTQDAIKIESNINIINNSGIIAAEAPSDATIYAASNVTIANALINSGDVVNVSGGTAIDLQNTTTKAAFTQNGGTISGDVLLPNLDPTDGGNIFTMNGGLITGDVIEGSNPNNTPYVMPLNGGTINGKLVLGDQGTTVKLAGTDVNIIDGSTVTLNTSPNNNVYEITGGSFNQLIGNNTGDDVDINATFTANGTILNVYSFNVNNPGTVFTANQPITFIFGEVDSGSKAIFNSSVGINTQLENFGTVIINDYMFIPPINANLYYNGEDATTIINADGLLETSIYLNDVGSTIAFEIGANSYGKIILVGPGTELADGSYVKPLFVPGDFFPNNSFYDVIVNNDSGVIEDSSQVIQPNSVILNVTKSLAGGPPEAVRLTVHRNSYTSFASTDSTIGIANALDFLAQGQGPSNHDLKALLGHLDTDTTPAMLLNDMESLVPPFNYGLVAGSHLGMDLVFDGLQSRLYDLQWYRHQSGNNYGDGQGHYGSWVKILGGNITQADFDDAQGYRANGSGAAIGFDFGVNDCLTLGVAGSYTKVNVDGKGDIPKDQAIQSYQGTVYAWYEPYRAFFVDGILGYAHEEITSNRVIHAGSIRTAAQASFDGNEYGALLDLGYDFTKGTQYFTAPVIRFKYLRLNLDDYTETGAGAFNLAVQNKDLNEFAGGIGLRFGMLTEAYGTEIVPELSLMGLYDFKVDNEVTLASFASTGPAFVTPGAVPGKAIFDLGLGVHAYLSKASIISAKYDFEAREKYFSNAGYIQYYYQWG